MRSKMYTVLVVSFAFLLVGAVFSTDASAAKRMVFAGGPAGGTFQVVANPWRT
jgi:hypothetical protein